MKNTFNMIIYPTISDFHGVKRFGDFFYYSQRYNGNSDLIFFLFQNRWKYNGETVLKSRLFIFYVECFVEAVFCSPITFCLTIIYKRVKFAHCDANWYKIYSLPPIFIIHSFWLILNKCWIWIRCIQCGRWKFNMTTNNWHDEKKLTIHSST